MPTFIEIIKDEKLNIDSSDYDLIQAIIKATLSKDFPEIKSNSDLTKFLIKNSLFIGDEALMKAVHLSSTAINVEVLAALLNKYSSSEQLTKQQIKLAKLAVLYFILDDVVQFEKDMSVLGINKETIEPFISALNNKNKKLDHKTIIQQLLEDAYNLDVRCITTINASTKKLEPKELEIFTHINKEHKSFINFSKEIEGIIDNHLHTIQELMKKNRKNILSTKLELNNNCYLAVLDTEREFLKEYIILSCLKSKRNISCHQIDLTHITLLDLYNKENSHLVNELINGLIHQKVEEIKKDPKVECEILLKNGCLVRFIDISDVDDELNTLHKNKIALEGKTTKELRAQLDQSKEKKVFPPSGFKWRPSSYYKSNLLIDFFGLNNKRGYSSDGLSGKIGLIINPSSEKGSIFPYFYKKDVDSCNTFFGKFKYNPLKGPHKNKENVEGIQKKIDEINNRRLGKIKDPGYAYFGNPYILYSEVLGTYEEEGVVGIIIEDNNEYSAKNALILRSKIGKPDIPFYRYSLEAGMVLLPEDKVMEMSRINSTLGSYLHFSIIKNNINGLNFSTPVIKIVNEEKEENNYLAAQLTLSYFFSHPLTCEEKEIYKKLKNLQETFKNNKLPDDVCSINSVTEEKGCISINLDIFVDFLKWLPTSEFKEYKDLSDFEKELIDKKIIASLEDYLFKNHEYDENPFYLNVNKISELKSITDKDIIGFEFNHPTQKAITCFAFMDSEGYPKMQFKDKEGKCTEAPTDLLNKIAKQFAKQETAKIDKLLHDHIIHPSIKGIKAEHYDSGKAEISWEIDVSDVKEIESINKIIDDNFPLVFYKVKNKTIENNVIQFQTLFLHHEDIENVIRQLFTSPAQSRSKSFL